MSQIVYNSEMSKGLKGQPADMNDSRNDILSYTNPDVDIIFGSGVAKKLGVDDGAELPTATGFKFIGVAVRNMQATNEFHPIKSRLGVMARGRILVVVEEDVTPDDDVYLIYDATNRGQFRTDADTNRADQVIGARFMDSASAGGLVTLDLNI